MLFEQGNPPDRSPSMDSDRRGLYAHTKNSSRIITHAPEEPFKLGYFDVLCLVVNFMIGTGVFNSHTRVLKGTDSIGAAMLLWFAGILYCLCGTHVYIEYGLNVPRYIINGVEQSVPRSGGDLNYLQYVFRKPAYRQGPIAISTCIFGIGFIVFGNMAGNAIKAAVGLLRAAGVDEPNNGAVRGIAIAVAFLTCFIHTFSRQGGIWLNNMFAMMKIGMLLCIIIIAIIVAARGMPKTDNVFLDNVNTSEAFRSTHADANGYSRAFLAVIFSFWGYEQPTYVLGEISRPRRKFPIGISVGVGLVCVLYMAVMISYLVVVPKHEQMYGDGGVAQQFFEITIGRLGSIGQGQRVYHTFITISSVGNMIVMTYTAARVKQEIAKVGFFPFAKFFAQNYDLSFGRVLSWLQHKGYFTRLLRIRWLGPQHHSEKTPVGAFVLHCFSCLVLICVTWSLTPDEAYELLANLAVYVINCFFGIWIGLGILILRFKGPPRTTTVNGHTDHSDLHGSWKKMTGSGINPTLSIFCATYFTICNIWPIVMAWIKPTIRVTSSLSWWLVPTIAWTIIALGGAWYLGFLSITKIILRRHHEIYMVEKKPEFEPVDSCNDEDGLVLVHETTYLSWIAHDATYLSWIGKETIQQQPVEELSKSPDSREEPLSQFAGTDFENYLKKV